MLKIKPLLPIDRKFKNLYLPFLQNQLEGNKFLEMLITSIENNSDMVVDSNVTIRIEFNDVVNQMLIDLKDKAIQKVNVHSKLTYKELWKNFVAVLFNA